MAELTSGRSAALLHQYPRRMAVVERALRQLGLAVVVKTAQLEDALTVIEDDEPDLLVVELETSGNPEEGVELLRRIREERLAPRIVAFSTRPELEWVDAALGAGAAAYVIDTPDADELTMAVHQAVAWAFSERRQDTAVAGSRPANGTVPRP